LQKKTKYLIHVPCIEGGENSETHSNAGKAQRKKKKKKGSEQSEMYFIRKSAHQQGALGKRTVERAHSLRKRGRKKRKKKNTIIKKSLHLGTA